MREFLEADRDTEPLRVASPRRGLSVAISGIAHGVLVVILCWHPDAIFVRPRMLAKGQGGAATPASMRLYIPRDVASAAPRQPMLLSLPVPAHQARNMRAPLQKRSNVLDRDEPPDEREAGSRLGSSFDGAANGDEVRQGFAVVYAPPHIARWELPGGVEGDVIVELSIDAQGNVVEEKLLQGIGQEVDAKVLAAVRDWHFRPATRNGVAIPFKYDARFHFPS